MNKFKYFVSYVYRTRNGNDRMSRIELLQDRLITNYKQIEKIEKVLAQNLEDGTGRHKSQFDVRIINYIKLEEEEK